MSDKPEFKGCTCTYVGANCQHCRDMTDKLELKPCPFCEGEAYRYKFEDLQNGSYVDQYHVACGNGNCEAEIMCDTQEEADSRWNKRADLAKPSEWISVDDRLPEDMLRVLLVTNPRGEVGIGRMDEENWCDDYHGYVSVTHWQPIPVPLKAI